MKHKAILIENVPQDGDWALALHPPKPTHAGIAAALMAAMIALLLLTRRG